MGQPASGVDLENVCDAGVGVDAVRHAFLAHGLEQEAATQGLGAGELSAQA